MCGGVFLRRRLQCHVENPKHTTEKNVRDFGVTRKEAIIPEALNPLRHHLPAPGAASQPPWRRCTPTFSVCLSRREVIDKSA